MSTEAIDPKYQDYKTPKALKDRLSQMKNVRPVAISESVRVAVIVGQWHSYIVDRLLQGCLLYTSTSPRDFG